jgi:DNA-binding NarL/FixJ family response regulator
MDHSYRNAQNGNGGGQFRPRGGALTPQFFQHPEIEPLPDRADGSTRIFAFVDDLFFQTKIQDTARKLNVKVEFVKADQEIADRLAENGQEPPALIIFDLNNANAKPLTTIPKLRSSYKRATTSILGFVSHVQGDLKMKAQEAGCDAVMPRSAFSQNLPQILRRHGAGDEPEELAQPGL